MNSKVYKWCAVPHCVNTSIKSPNKLFVYVPHKKPMRNKWLSLAQRDPEGICLNSPIYFCEDHFDLPNDMDNYMEYHVMGTVSQVRMKPGCFPTKFECQTNKRKLSSIIKEQPQMPKIQRKKFNAVCEINLEAGNSITKSLDLETASGISVLHKNIEDIPPGKRKADDKSIQVHMTHDFKIKPIQTDTKFINQMALTIKPKIQSFSASPSEMEKCCTTSKQFITAQMLHTFKKKILKITDNNKGMRVMESLFQASTITSPKTWNEATATY